MPFLFSEKRLLSQSQQPPPRWSLRMWKLRPLAWSDVTSDVLDGTSAVRHDEQAATNDASIGVQVQLPPRSNFPPSSTPACGVPPHGWGV